MASAIPSGSPTASMSCSVYAFLSPLAIPGGMPYASPHAKTLLLEGAGSHHERLSPGTHPAGPDGAGAHHRLALAAGNVPRPPGAAVRGGRGQRSWAAPGARGLLPARPDPDDL